MALKDNTSAANVEEAAEGGKDVGDGERFE